MAFNVNNPPPDVVVSTIPSTKELGDRSRNIMPPIVARHRSLDGRQLVTTINGSRFGLVAARNILADKYPTGLNSSIDAAQSPGGGLAPPAAVSANVSTWDQIGASHNPLDITSPTRTLTVPSGNPGQLLLKQSYAPITTQYSKNGGAWTTFIDNTILNVINNDTLAFKALALEPQYGVLVTVVDNSNTQEVGSGTLENIYTPPEGGGG